uniref:Transposase n=1 Tax=Knipowitschia caucasica TaxID=637954 RepID=A0AAV2LSQ8_KNICA
MYACCTLHTERQVLAEFNQITSSKLGNDFVEALDCLTTQFIKLFKAKRGTAGAKLSKIVRHLDSFQRRWRKEKGTQQKRWWNCRKTLARLGASWTMVETPDPDHLNIIQDNTDKENTLFRLLPPDTELQLVVHKT